MTAYAFSDVHLAQRLCDALHGHPIHDKRSGLCLVSHEPKKIRQFIMDDLQPEALSREWLSIFIELGQGNTQSSARIIDEVILSQLIQQPSDQANCSSLSSALATFSSASEQAVLLIIHDARHTLENEDAINRMFTLKSARDRMNLSDQPAKLMLLFISEDMQSLQQLTGHQMPFFGVILDSIN
jgi:hypothetical protein